MFVKMVFAVYMPGGGRMLEKAASVSVVNCSSLLSYSLCECVSVLL